MGLNTVHIHMEKDETTVDLQDETIEEETTTAEEAEVEEAPETEETTVTDAPEEKLTYEQKLARATTPEEKFRIADAEAAKNRRLLNKKPKVESTPSKDSSKLPSQPSVEETVLLANGMDEALVKKLKSVAKVEGYTSLLKAQNDPVFIAVKTQFEKDKKQKEAALPGSRRAGAVKPVKGLTSPGLSRDEHMKMVRELNG